MLLKKNHNMIPKSELIQLIKNSNSAEDYLRIVRKHLIHGLPYVFDNKSAEYYDFREMIAKRWNVGFHEVLIMGSGKLGYSYHKDSVFSNESDIDVAIINSKLFEDFCVEIRNFQYKIDKHIEILTKDENLKYNKFLSYMIKGWMRPDLIPPKITGKLSSNEWFNYFKSISYSNNPAGNYKISAGLFKNYEYMEWYYVNSIMSVK